MVEYPNGWLELKLSALKAAVSDLQKFPAQEEDAIAALEKLAGDLLQMEKDLAFTEKVKSLMVELEESEEDGEE